MQEKPESELFNLNNDNKVKRIINEESDKIHRLLFINGKEERNIMNRKKYVEEYFNKMRKIEVKITSNSDYIKDNNKNEYSPDKVSSIFTIIKSKIFGFSSKSCEILKKLLIKLQATGNNSNENIDTLINRLVKVELKE